MGSNSTALDAILSLVAESKATVKADKRAKKDAIEALFARPVYHWVLASEVRLQVTRYNCLTCGASFEAPGYVMLKYEAKGVIRWKRLEPGESIPQNPIKSTELTMRDVAYCSHCFMNAELKAPAAAMQPELPLEVADTLNPAEPDYSEPQEEN